MRRTVSKLALLLMFAGLALLSTAAPSAAQDPGALVAPKDKALVVFVRPGKLGKAVNFYVYDASKKLLTLFKGNQRAAIAVDPGKRTFYVVSENAGLVRAELGAGRTYVVHTQPKMGFGKARVLVRAVVRSSPDFAESAEWLSDTKVAEPDFAKGNKWTSKNQDSLNKRIADAEAEWASLDANVKAAHTMSVEDGRTQEEASKIK